MMNSISLSWRRGSLPKILFISILAAAMAVGLLWATNALENKWLAAIIVGITMLLAATSSGHFERIMFTLFFFLIPLNADFHLHPVEVSSATQELGLSSLDIILFFLYLSWFIRLLSERRSDMIYWPPAAGPLIGLVGWGALSIINARYPLISSFLLFEYIKAFFYFFYCANNIKTRNDLWLIARCLIAGLIIECLIAFAQHVHGGNFGLAVLGERMIDKEMQLSADKIYRVGGTLGHPNYLGGYLTSILPLILALNLTKFDQKFRVMTIGAFFLGCVVLILTYSRSAWLAAAIGFAGLFFSLVVLGRARFKLIPTVLTALAIGITLVVFLPRIMERWTEDDKGSTASRIAQMRVAASMISKHPILGIGLNNYDSVKDLYESYVENQAERGKVMRVHDIFVFLAAETGPIGLIWFLWFLWVVARRGWEKIKAARDELVCFMLLGFGFGIFARLLHEAAHTGGLANNTLLWIASAILVSKREFANE